MSLEDRFRVLDQVNVPDLWSEVPKRTPGGKIRRPRRFLTGAFALVVAIISTVLVIRAFLGAGEQSQLATPAGGEIAFAGHAAGQFEDIYVVRADGTGLRPITDNPAADRDPAWSPDGSRIAFVSDRDGNPEIYVVNLDGSGLMRLTTSPRDLYGPAQEDSQPTWSPDGSKIGFVSYRDGHAVIYVMNSDGSQQRPLTGELPTSWAPAWSPDGSKIAFATSRDGNPEIYVMNTDGTNLGRLTQNPAEDSYPAWSPDGTRIAFWSNRGTQGSEGAIYAMRADGSDVTRVATSPADGLGPSWSPDGSSIVFARENGGRLALYRVGADGRGQTLVTSQSWDAYDPAWGPVVASASSGES
jgi:Tol biopolymer transport system component